MFGASGAKPSGFSFGATPATSAGTGGFTFGTPSTQASQNVTFGGTGQTPATSGTTSFSFGTTPSSAGGFKLGGTTPAFPSTKTTTPSTAGFTLGGAATQAAGFRLGAPATSTPPFPGSTTTASTAPTVGFALPIPSTSAGLGGGLTGGIRPTLTSTSSTAGGFPGFSTTSVTKPTGLLGATTATGSIFGTQATTSQTVGLGGVDPKTSTATSGGLTVDPKAGDGKTLKKSQIPPEIMKTVEDFKTYVKEEKSEQEGISRMSSKPMYKVQQDVASLKQLLSIVSNGLQRNACAVEKLKREMTQELKNAEMAQRTKDIPAGLQYENTAPTEYFQQLVEDFETQMLTYRQQIETLEGHLHSISQPSILSPEELIDLLRKLHEAFIALAAQLHQVHEAVKTQKEHYLNYRKIFLHDTKNIFEREKKPVKAKVVVDHFGPSPFSGLSNAAAVAMASALTKSQQPASAPPVARLGALGQTPGGFGSTGLFGATTTTAPAFGFGLGATTTTAGFGGFGSTTTSSSGFSFSGLNTATVRPLGFGTPTTTTPSLFGTPQTGQTTTAFGSPQLFPSGGGEQPFQLNKPPGTKRNKR